MHSSRAQNENHRNLANLRTTPDAKPRPAACLNHPDKPATHALPQPHPHPLLHYCEKCSIMLASKGHNILKLTPTPASTPHPAHSHPLTAHSHPLVHRSPLPSRRQQEIQQFLGELSWHLEELGRRYNESEEVLRGSETHYAGVLQQVTGYFRELEEVLEVQKYLSYNAILNQRAAAEAEVRLAREAMEQEAEELAAIGNDIQNNMEAVEQVEPAIYESIMENYRHKAAAAFDFHLDLAPLPRPALNLPEIPKMLYSLADKLTLRNDSPRQTLTMPPQAVPKQSLSSRVSVRNPSCENSRRQAGASCSPRPGAKKSLSNLANLKNAESIDDKEREIVFSFESNEGEEHPLQKALFGRRDYFLPQEMVFRESLSLTEIRENEQEEPHCRRYGGVLEETIPIPEEMMASQESIGGYFATNTLNYSPRGPNDRGEDTETLLIC